MILMILLAGADTDRTHHVVEPRAHYQHGPAQFACRGLFTYYRKLYTSSISQMHVSKKSISQMSNFVIV